MLNSLLNLVEHLVASANRWFCELVYLCESTLLTIWGTTNQSKTLQMTSIAKWGLVFWLCITGRSIFQLVIAAFWFSLCCSWWCYCCVYVQLVFFHHFDSICIYCWNTLVIYVIFQVLQFHWLFVEFRYCCCCSNSYHYCHHPRCNPCHYCCWYLISLTSSL